jgi:hypothetical protein
MFGWFASSDCPADFAAKTWLEDQLDWLSREFPDWLHEHPVVEPTPRFFPDEYDRSPRAVRRMLDRVCRYMGVAPRRVELALFSESRRPVLVDESGDEIGGAAGTYQNHDDGRCRIRLEQGQLDRPMDLVGTIAHELSHERLIGEGRIDPDRFDNELLTDLTTTYLGFGIFLANCPRDWKSDYSTWPGTELARSEYMSLPMYGYALAMIARERREDDPAWAKHLRRDARSAFRQGQRFLAKRG